MTRALHARAHQLRGRPAPRPLCHVSLVMSASLCLGLRAACAAGLRGRGGAVRVSVRHMGILDTMTAKLQARTANAQEEKQRERAAAGGSRQRGSSSSWRRRRWRDAHVPRVLSRSAGDMISRQLKNLADRPSFTLADHINLLKESAREGGMTGWRAALRSTKEQASSSTHARARVGPSTVSSLLVWLRCRPKCERNSQSSWWRRR